MGGAMPNRQMGGARATLARENGANLKEKEHEQSVDSG